MSSSLDLSDGPAPLAAPQTAPARRLRTDQRAPSGRRTILTVAAPTVTLTRLQTGVGTLAIEAINSSEVGDLRLGCAYQLRSGYASTVQHSGGNRFGPAETRRPLIVGQREQYDRISVDLRQCRDLERLIIYAFSETRTQLKWGGTLVVTTLGGAKIELPIQLEPVADVAVLMSLYNVHGEFVLRSEMALFYGSIRDACRAYGYEQITWVDDRTPAH